jgi:hypothetical protein
MMHLPWKKMCSYFFLVIIPGILAKEFAITEFVRHDTLLKMLLES